MRIIELFAGIGACSVALKRIGIDLEIVDAVEIDKYAMASFNAIHNTNFEIQDICKWDKYLKDIDIITHGSPCQDFSVAGKQAGGDKDSGTRSSLMYETIRIVGKIKPKYVLWENVKNILSKKHRHNFDKYLEEMQNLGYENYYQVLNAKDYGIPQNRERVYTISIRSDSKFEFPEKEKLKIKLKDMLEDEVDEKYYLKDYQIQNIKKSNFSANQRRIQNKDYCDTLCARDWKDPKCIQVGNLDIKGHDSIKRIYSDEGLSPTLTDMQGGNRQPKILIKNATKQGYIEAKNGDSVNLQYPNSTTRRGRVGHQVSQTLMASDNMGVVEKTRIRKLTPKECWRLMGFSDEDFEKAKNIPTSNTQLYKQAGNSIVVNALEKIFINLFKRKGEI